MANPQHVEIAKSGGLAIAKWQWRHPRARLDLSGANLRRAGLSGADLSRAHLTGADLSGADLRRARLWRAELSAAGLTEADLSMADLSGADLTEADLSVADLSGGDLRESNLSNASCGFTSFARCDLSRARGLEAVRHHSPSSIGVDTLTLTLEGAGGHFTPSQRVFFEAAGVPRSLLDYLPDLLESQPLQFFSCFISYGTGDEEFADRLHKNLKACGVTCYKYDEDAIMGRGVWANIGRAIILHEKMIVVCSESSLQRPGVQGEIERALQKEEQLKRERAERSDAEMDTDVLVPVRLDDYVRRGWEHERKADVIAKHIGDFRRWRDEERYQKAFQQLLRALDPRAKLGLSRKG